MRWFLLILSIVLLQSACTSNKNSGKYGLKGDGKVDDTKNIQRAFDNQTEIDLGSGIYRITSKLTVRKNGLLIKGNNAQLLFDGSYQEKLLWIAANDVRFEGITFNGNSRQVGASLVHIAGNSKKVSFKDCEFTAVKGTHQGGNNQLSNCQYAVTISPNKVIAAFEGCRFKNISNDNSGKYTPAFVGGGVTGGIFFVNPDFKNSQYPESEATKASINNCRFENIKTILANALPDAKQIEFDDADAIRTYSLNGQRLDLTVTNSVFKDISKRAIKFSGTKGGTVKKCTVEVQNLQYAMVTAFKLGMGNEVEDVKISGLLKRPIRMAFQMHDAKDISIKNVQVKNCAIFLNSAPISPTAVISNITIEGIVCDNCQGGIRNSTFSTQVKDVKLLNIQIKNTSSSPFLGFENIMASTGNNENYINGIFILNGHLKFSGYNNRVENVKIRVDAKNKEHIFYANKCLIEAFGAKKSIGNKTRINSFRGLDVEIQNLPPTYFKGRNSLIHFYGDNADFSDISLKVSPEESKAKSHVFIGGNNLKLDGLAYQGSGYVQLGTSAWGSKQMEVKQLNRKGGSRSNNASFIEVENVQNLDLLDITDEEKSNSPTINVVKSKNCTIENVKSATKHTEIVRGGKKNVILKRVNRIISQ